MLGKKLKGISLLEIIIVIGIFSLTSIIVAPFAIVSVQSANLESEAKSLVSAIVQVQTRNKSGLNNKRFGIKLFSNKYSLFIGNDYSSAESSVDNELSLGNSISSINLTSGSTEISFEEYSITPIYTGSFNLISANFVYQININPEGLVTYNKL